MRNYLIIFCVFLMGRLQGQVKPWCDNNIPIILDAYALNEYDMDMLLKDPRVTAILHRSSQGFNTDKKYFERKKAAKAAGLLWGCYHLATNKGAVEQARFFLKEISPQQDELIAVDVEEVPPGHALYFPTDSLKIFAKFVFDSIGRYPMFYCGKAKLKDITVKYPNDPILKNCLLWVVSINKESPAVVLSDPRYSTIWKSHTFWQFSNELNCKMGWGKCSCAVNQNNCCLYPAASWNYDMDLNVYNGTISELKQNWPLN